MAANKTDKAVVGRECPSCKMRYRFGPPTPLDFSGIVLEKATFRFLLAAAREFDETAERLTPQEMFTAVDFLDWIRPSLINSRGPRATDAAGRRPAKKAA